MSWEPIKQARQQFTREQGTIVKEWGGRIPVALVYPNSYHIGMSNLGFQTIYGFLNKHNDIVCERIFHSLDRKPQNQRMPNFSIETQRSPHEFQIIAFSISYELDYYNVVQFLKNNKIPIYSKDRNEQYPLIIAGGPCLTANPEPLAPFFDCIAIGEAEAILPAFIEGITRSAQLNRTDLLNNLSKIPGLYVPGVTQGKVQRQWVHDINSFSTTSVVLTPDTELRGMYLIEISRGCTWGCRFCLAGFHFRPRRFRSMESILTSATSGLKHYKKVGLVGTAISDHPQIEEIVTNLRKIGASVSVSSLRIKPVSDVVLKAVISSDGRTLAIAPEAGSEKLLALINKGITKQDILKAIVKLSTYKLKHLKLYFMIGLPTETDDDIDQLINIAYDSKVIIDKHKLNSIVTLNINPFIPKAGTPFQWMPMASLSVLNNRLSKIQSALKQRGIRVKTESLGWSVIQSVISRGDKSISRVLNDMDSFTLAEWRKSIESNGLKLESYTQSLPLDKELPWSFIETGVDVESLKREIINSIAGK